MRLFEIFFPPRASSSAQTAKDRLQVILAHERQDRSQPDYLPALQKDILGVIRKYADVASDKLHVRLQRGERMSILEIEVELPSPQRTVVANSAAAPSSAFAPRMTQARPSAIMGGPVR